MQVGTLLKEHWYMTPLVPPLQTSQVIYQGKVYYQFLILQKLIGSDSPMMFIKDLCVIAGQPCPLLQRHLNLLCTCTYVHYCSHVKECPWAEHLTSLPKRRVGFQVLSHLTTKECPCHVYRNFLVSIEIIRQTLTYNRATSGINVKSKSAMTWLNFMSSVMYLYVMI